MATATAEFEMADKKKSQAAKPPKDVFLRMPPEYGELLRKLRARTGRAATVETQIALERRAKFLGIEFTPNYPEDL